MIYIYEARYEETDRREAKRAEHEIGLGLLYKGLLEAFGITKAGAIEKGVHGKPFLKAYPQLHFNISHTKGLVVCSLGDEEMGIDVEWIRPFHERILQKALSPRELSHLKGLSPEERMEYFFRIWTLKESYVKALGCGITAPFTELSFELTGDYGAVCSKPDVFCRQRRSGDYILSLCSFSSGPVCFPKAFQSLTGDGFPKV